MSISLKGTSFF